MGRPEIGRSDDASPDPAPGRVVVAVDDELDRVRVTRALEREGFDLGQATGQSVAPEVAIVVADTTSAQRHLVPTVVVSRDADRAAVDRALAAGALGFVPEGHVDERLGATVRAVAAGQVAVPAEHRTAVTRPVLSSREKQVLSMVVLGFTNVEIATKLHVTETTVKSHLSSAYRKLRVRSRHEATALILTNKDLGLGILTLEGARAAG